MVGARNMQEPISRVRGRLLVVDDDPQLLKSMRRTLTRLGFSVDTAPDGRAATEQLSSNEYHCVISDISMPELGGIGLLSAIREHDFDVPVILVTGEPAVDTAVQAVEHGALHYLSKPVDFGQLERVIEKGMREGDRLRTLRQSSQVELRVAALDAEQSDREHQELGDNLNRTLDKMWMAFQPIVRVNDGSIYGHEALLRSDEKVLPHPGAIIEAAEELGRLCELGQRIRSEIATTYQSRNREDYVFVNLHPRDLQDPALFAPDAPLNAIAENVVLEITERSTLDAVSDFPKRIAELREKGYRIAIDDLGSGYAGLNSLAMLEPDIVKLDMTLIRDVHKHVTKQKLIRSFTNVCKGGCSWLNGSTLQAFIFEAMYVSTPSTHTTFGMPTPFSYALQKLHFHNPLLLLAPASVIAVAFETLAPLLLLAPAHLASVPFAVSGLAFHYGIALLQNSAHAHGGMHACGGHRTHGH